MCVWRSNGTLCWLNKEDRTCCSPIWERFRYVVLFWCLGWVCLSGFSIKTHENQIKESWDWVLMEIFMWLQINTTENTSATCFSKFGIPVLHYDTVIYLGNVLRVLSWWEGFSQWNGNNTRETKWKERICNVDFYDSRIYQCLPR